MSLQIGNLFFARDDDGNVIIRMQVTGIKKTDTHEAQVSAELWPDVVAYLSAYGNTPDAWKEARALHLGLHEGWIGSSMNHFGATEENEQQPAEPQIGGVYIQEQGLPSLVVTPQEPVVAEVIPVAPQVTQNQETLPTD